MGTKRAWKTVGASPMKPAGRRSRESWPTRRSALPGLRAAHAPRSYPGRETGQHSWSEKESLCSIRQYSQQSLARSRTKCRASTGMGDLKTAVQPKKTKRSERVRRLHANADPHLPGEWRLLQNLSFGIFRSFRPSICRIQDDRFTQPSVSRLLSLSPSVCHPATWQMANLRSLRLTARN